MRKFIKNWLPLLVLLFVGGLQHAVAQTISGLSTAVYTEGAGRIFLQPNMTVTGGTGFGGGYVIFKIASPSTADQLGLESDANPNASGAISVDAGAVYLGTGSGRTLVGSVDGILNGQNGKDLKVNFTSNFSNSSFEAGLDGWTVINQMVDLGVSSVAGFVTPNDPTPGGGDSDVPLYVTYDNELSTSQFTNGTRSLRLYSDMTTQFGCDIVHGPAVYSAPFQSNAGDVLYFDWRAFAGSDAYDVFGYILNVNTGATTIVLNQTGTSSSSTPWATASVSVPATGTYRFVFISGTFDATCGQAAGASLYIDNVRVFGDNVNASVIQSIARKVTYNNTCGTSAAAKSLQVSIVKTDNTSATATSSIQLNTFAPVARCKSITVVLNASGNATIAENAVDNGSTDNCALSFDTDKTTFNCSNIGDNLVTLSVRDSYGNISTCTATVTVVDNLAPVVPSLPVVNAQCRISLTAPTTTDNCAGTVTGTTEDPMTYTQQGTFIVHWTFTDAYGNASTQNQTVVIADVTAPTIIAPAAVSANTNSGCTATNVVLGTPVASDNCGVANVVNNAPASFPLGNTTVTWTVTDVNGRTATATQTVTVLDRTAPVPNVASLPNVTGECSATAIAPKATDNCSGIITATTADALTYSAQGTYTIHWVYTDAAGNTAQQNQTVIVKDVTPPVIACPFNITVNAAANSCGAVVTYSAPSATDNCGNGVLPTSLTGYTYKGTFGGHTYFLSNSATTPEDAHAQSIALGGHLVTISSLAENQFVSAMSPSYIWIGHTDRAVEGTFKWVTSEPVTYTNWNSGEPNNAGDEDWAVINWGPNGTWNDWYYTASALYVVEFEGGNIPTTLASGPASGATFPIGNTNVTWEAVDAGGNRATCTFTVTVIDNQNPTIAAPAAVTVNTNPGSCFATNVALGSPVANDNCAGFIVSNNAPATFAKGTTIVTWTVKDASGRIATATQSVLVVDNEAPAITAPATVTVNTNPGACAATNVTLGNAVATDNCPGVIVSNNAPAVYPKGTTVVTWTAKDAAGKITTATQNVVVVDNQYPMITAPASVTVNTDAGTCAAANVALGNATASDNCPGVIVSNNAPATFPKGTTIVTWTATDASGNITTANQTVIVNDNEAPVVSTPVSMTVANNAGICGAVVNFPVPAATDNCGAVTVAQVAGPVSGSVFPVGTTMVSFEATDAAGNKSSVSFNVTVTDNEAPVPTVGTGTSQSSGSVTIGLPSGYSVNWNMYQFGFQDPLPAGATVTGASMFWSGHDQGWGGTGAWARMVVSGTHIGSGQYFGWNQYFSINYTGAIAGYNYGGVNYVRQDFDTYPGWVGYFNGGSLTLNYTVSAAGSLPDVNAECAVTVPAPTATDNCGGIITGTTNDATTYNQQGSYIIHWTYTDAAGNSTSQDQKVIIRDITAPVLVGVPADATVECDAVPAAAVVTATDNCAAGDVSYNEVRTNGDCPSNYTLTRTWSVTDIGGNTTTATQVVTVRDTKAPTLAVQDVTASNDAAQCGAAVAFAATASDICSTVSVSYSHQPGSYFPVGATTVTATATDACGNTTVKTFTVTVNDTEAAVVHTQNLTIQLDAAGAAAITAAQVDNNSTDNCGIASVSVDKTSFNCSNVGANTVTLTVTDIHGNVSNATAVVTVEDKIAPIVSCPANPARYCYVDNQQYAVPVVSATDNCTVASYTYSISGATIRTGSGTNASGFFAPGTSVITWTVTDVNGNSSSCTTTIVVNPKIDASFNSFTLLGGAANTLYTSDYAAAASATITVTPTGGTAPYSYSWSKSGAAATFTANGASIVATAVGQGSVTFTVVVTDAQGCSKTFTKTIQVVDVRCGNKGDKVLVCQKTGSAKNPWVQICIAPSAVATHLNNGSYLGNCSGTAVTRTINGQQPETEASADATVMAFPNPSRGLVNLRIAGITGPVQLTVIDSRGNTVARRAATVTSRQDNVQLDLHTAAAGIYTVRISDGTQVLQTRVVIAR
ncbi:MAG: HYR domain-containing protein [Chitinophagaceae bacterium]|nr:MAG: HYR domain-containing protein [Chitinophagaceae bacterium]